MKEFIAQILKISQAMEIILHLEDSGFDDQDKFDVADSVVGRHCLAGSEKLRMDNPESYFMDTRNRPLCQSLGRHRL